MGELKLVIILVIGSHSAWALSLSPISSLSATAPLTSEGVFTCFWVSEVCLMCFLAFYMSFTCSFTVFLSVWAQSLPHCSSLSSLPSERVFTCVFVSLGVSGESDVFSCLFHAFYMFFYSFSLFLDTFEMYVLSDSFFWTDPHLLQSSLPLSHLGWAYPCPLWWLYTVLCTFEAQGEAQWSPTSLAAPFSTKGVSASCYLAIYLVRTALWAAVYREIPTLHFQLLLPPPISHLCFELGSSAGLWQLICLICLYGPEPSRYLCMASGSGSTNWTWPMDSRQPHMALDCTAPWMWNWIFPTGQLGWHHQLEYQNGAQADDQKNA